MLPGRLSTIASRRIAARALHPRLGAAAAEPPTALAAAGQQRVLSTRTTQPPQQSGAQPGAVRAADSDGPPEDQQSRRYSRPETVAVDGRQPKAAGEGSQRSRRWPGHRLFAALQGSPLGSWLLPMVGLGAAASYDAAGGVGLAAAAAERRGVYQRERSFAKFTGGAPGDRSTKRPTGRRRKAKSAWLDPLE
jgi:hypothetical protein